MRDIRSAFRSDKEFAEYFAAQKWTPGIRGRRPNLLSDVAFQYMMGSVFGYEYSASLTGAVLRKDTGAIKVLGTHNGRGGIRNLY